MIGKERQHHAAKALANAIDVVAFVDLEAVGHSEAAHFLGNPLVLRSQAIGITIVSGFAIGTLFTLFVLPVIYTFFAEDHRPRNPDEESITAAQLV